MTAVVNTAQGKLHGIQEDGLHVFRGIPFAAPPVGDLRFRAPQPHPGWDGVRDATEFGPIAIQRPNEALDRVMGGAPQPQSEDCLFLNLWTPGLDDDARPVMVWIHGGGLTIGSGSETYYSGANLAARGDVVVVTINYRLGVLGFSHVSALGATNFGLRDQAAALAWVRDNIASFGGDPANVTIFGESAGGLSVAALMASPQTAGLFHRAIVQSGGVRRYVPADDAARIGEALCDYLGLRPDDADGLRAVDPDAILDAQHNVVLTIDAEESAGAAADAPTSAPVVDGDFLLEPQLEAIARGRAAGISTLIGTMDEEWNLFGALVGGEPPNEAQAVERLNLLHGDGRRVYDTYRRAREARGEAVTPAAILNAASGDSWFIVASERMADSQSQHQPQTFSYTFDWKSPAFGGVLGSCHALDIPFTFGTQVLMPEFAGSGPEADALAACVMDAWTAFARCGDPSTPDLSWPAYNTNTRSRIMLGANVRVEDHWRAEERSVWRDVI